MMPQTKAAYPQDPFWEPGNLVILAIAGMTALVTWDWFFVPCMVGWVLVYWLLTHQWSRGRTWAQKRAAQRAGLDPLNVALLVVAACFIILICACAFEKHLLSLPLPGLTHSELWEGGAIGSTFLFVIYYYCKWDMEDTGLWKVALPLLGFWCGSYAAAWYWRSHAVGHVALIFGGSIFLLLFDVLLAKRHNKEKEKARSWQSLLFADIPLVVGLLVLLCYLFFQSDVEYPEAFVGGAIAFQFLVSNVLFFVTEFDLLNKVNPPEPTSRSQSVTGGGLSQAVILGENLETQ